MASTRSVFARECTCLLLLRSTYSNNCAQDNPSMSCFCSGGLRNSSADSCHPSYRGSSHGWQSASRVVRVGSTVLDTLDMHTALKGHLVLFIFQLKSSPKTNPSRRVPRRAMPSAGSYRPSLVTRVAQLQLGHVFFYLKGPVLVMVSLCIMYTVILLNMSLPAYKRQQLDPLCILLFSYYVCNRSRLWEGPEIPQTWLAAMARKKASLSRWEAAIARGDLLDRPVDLSNLFNPNTFLNAVRQQVFILHMILSTTSPNAGVPPLATGCGKAFIHGSL